ncbi:CLUMA_CG011862, isoform A [Clunio marinus]|uniref:CLUMA_CG011862, isoform A n=1 Tax=Clunio marinus TaxID=568069 RepID=A0A1J1IFH3_9DIPT|nr:CLUMA_CG011862, isoform A [Clunio marinus]
MKRDTIRNHDSDTNNLPLQSTEIFNNTIVKNFTQTIFENIREVNHIALTYFEKLSSSVESTELIAQGEYFINMKLSSEKYHMTADTTNYE